MAMKTESRIAAQGALTRYLKISNLVIDRNRQAFPFSEIWKASASTVVDRKILLAIEDDDGLVTGAVAVFWAGDRLDWYPVEYAADPTYLFCQSYIDQIVFSPAKYLYNPALMDWNWLQEDYWHSADDGQMDDCVTAAE